MIQRTQAETHVRTAKRVKNKDVVWVKNGAANVKQVQVWHRVHNDFGIQKGGHKRVQVVDVKRLKPRRCLGKNGIVEI